MKFHEHFLQDKAISGFMINRERAFSYNEVILLWKWNILQKMFKLADQNWDDSAYQFEIQNFYEINLMKKAFSSLIDHS